MCWPEGELERSLAGGAHRRELAAWFGESAYRRLASLARQAAEALQRPALPRRSARALPVVYVIPGLLGSQLGWEGRSGQSRDLLWLDADDLCNGRLLSLRWRSGGGTLRPLGAIPQTYLALKLRLAAAGYRVVVYDYDWRADIGLIAVQLAHRLQREEGVRLALIGHSMGGLVARAALARCASATARRIERLIGLGTPHGGSIGAVQALRGTYPALLRLAALDQRHDARALSERVFASFASIYQLLPCPLDTLDLSDPGSWPRSGPQPQRRLLASAQGFQATLPPADARFINIIGAGRRTVTDLSVRNDQFSYQISDAGDGTVPVERARLPGARDYSLACEHSELPRSPRVAAALIDLLRTGRTARLRSGSPIRASRRVEVSDAMLSRAFQTKVDWHGLSAAARRRYLNDLNAPPAIYGVPRSRATRLARR